MGGIFSIPHKFDNYEPRRQPPGPNVPGKDTHVKRVLILGAGTAGMMAVNKLSEKLDDSFEITIVDQDDVHYYQPGFLFLPFGGYEPSDGLITCPA